MNVTDENGNIVPNAENKVTFEVSGDGVLAGIDNGRPIDHQPTEMTIEKHSADSL